MWIGRRIGVRGLVSGVAVGGVVSALVCVLAAVAQAQDSDGAGPMRLEPGRWLEVELAGGESVRFELSPLAETHGLVRADQHGVDVVLSLEAPPGGATTVDGPLRREGLETLVYSLPSEPALPSDTLVVLEVRGAEAEAPRGMVRLRLDALPARSSAERLRLEAERTSSRAHELLDGELLDEKVPPSTEGGVAARSVRASHLLHQALALWAALDDRDRQAWTWLQLGAHAEHLVDYPAAVAAYGEALTLWREARDRRGMALALGSLGLAHMFRGDLELAHEHLRQALQLRDDESTTGAVAQTASLRNQLCLVLQKLGRWAAAEACSEEVLVAARALGDDVLEARVLNNLGGIASNRGDPRTARRRYEEALALRRRLGDDFGVAAAFNNLGAFHRARGDLDAAVDAYERALAIFERAGNGYWQARTLNNLAYAQLVIGDPERALELLPRALELRRAVGDRSGEATTLRNLARAFAARGDLERASTIAREALATSLDLDDRRGETTARRLLGELLLDAGEAGSARGELEASLEALRAMGKRDDQASVLELLSRARRLLGDLDAAEALAQEALELHRTLQQPLGEVSALVALARIERARGRSAAAVARSDEALARFEPLHQALDDVEQRALFLATQHAVYDVGIAARLDRHRAEPAAGHAARALELSERGRSRSLLDLLERVGAAAPLPGDGAVDPPRLDAAMLRALLEPASDDSVLPDTVLLDTVLLEFFLGEEASVLWWVTPTEITAFELPARATVESLARRAQAAVSSLGGSRAEAHKALAALGAMLLGPVADRLDGQRLVIVADGALHLVPFAALDLPPGARHAGRAVLLHHEVVHVPSATVLATLRAAAGAGGAGSGPSKRATAPALALVADPLFDAAGGLEPLPSTRREAEAIARLVPAERVDLALGADARRERVLEPGGALARADIVHFATHGLLDANAPERSGLALAQRDSDGRPLEGFLGLGDIATLELDADLVVLSGCRTALGRRIRGEGVVGLARAFMAAGASRVVGSLWPVRDEAAAELMTRFYRALLEDGQTPAAALRSAQQSLRAERRWRDPYFWAPFTVQGDWRTAPDSPAR